MDKDSLGSVSLGFEVDLKDLQRQLDRAETLVTQFESQAIRRSAARSASGGLLGNLLGGAAAGGVFGEMEHAMKGSNRSMGTLLATSAKLGVALAGVVLVAKTLRFAFDQMMNSLRAAGDQQAINTSFEVMIKNLGIAESQVAAFRKELEKLNYIGSEQTQIMQGLVQSMGANGLTKEALGAVKAMRDLSVAGGVSSKEGIGLLNQAITTLNPQLLQNFGLTQTATQVFDAYGATINKTADEMSTTEKQQAILNAVMERGAASAGLADKAQGTLNRTAVQLADNFKELQGGVGKIFEPLATGILSAINTEIFGLSKIVADNKTQFQALGQMLANAVIPTVKGVIAWFKALPWPEIINGAYVTAQAFQLVSRVIGLAFGTLVNNIRFAMGSFKALGGGIGLIIAVFQTAAAAVANFWQVLIGNQSVDQALANIGNTASKSIMGAFDQIIDGAFEMADATGAQIDNIAGFFQQAGGDIAQIIKGFDIKSWWAGLPKGVKDAGEEALKHFTNSTAGMSEKAVKAMRKMREQLQKENADFARQQEKSARDFEEQLAELTAQHRDRIQDIRNDISRETKSYQKALDERTRDYQDQMEALNKADRDRKNDVRTQLAEELAKGRFADQTKIAALRARLEYEDAQHKIAVEKAEQNYNEDVKNAKDAHDERLTELQTNLDKELAIQNKHAADFARYRDYQIKDDITKLKEKYAEERAESARNHKQRIADIVKNGAEEAAQSAANGAATGNAYNSALGGALSAGAPNLNKLANQNAKNLASSASSGITQSRGGWISTIGKFVSDGLNSIGTFFNNAVNWGKDLAKKIGEGIRNGYIAVRDGIANMFNRVVGTVGSTLSSFGRAFIGGVGRAIKSVLGPAGPAFQTAWNAIGLPRFAYGGIVGGVSGVDNNAVAVTRGEMILNKDQQSRMFNLLSGRINPEAALGQTSSGVNIENLTVSLPSVRNASDFERELQLKFQTMRAI